MVPGIGERFGLVLILIGFTITSTQKPIHLLRYSPVIEYLSSSLESKVIYVVYAQTAKERIVPPVAPSSSSSLSWLMCSVPKS